MRVRAKADRLSEEQRTAIGGSLAQSSRLAVREGSEYVVLGMVLASNSRVLGSAMWVVFEDAAGNGVQAPLALFEIVSARPSKYWQVQKLSESEVALCPSEFARPHFFEDAAEGDASARAELARIRALLDAEDRRAFVGGRDRSI